MVASFSPSWTMRGDFSPPRKHSRIRRSYNAGLSRLGSQTNAASVRSRRRSFLNFAKGFFLGCSHLNLNRMVFPLDQRSRTSLAFETPAIRLRVSVASTY
jgi:hypothetical protein